MDYGKLKTWKDDPHAASSPILKWTHAVNANRTTLCAALAALTMTGAWAGSATAQSNASDTTFFPMHQGNRWIFEKIESTNPLFWSYTIFEIKNPVIVENGVFSTRYDYRLPDFLRRPHLLCGEEYHCYEDTWVEYEVNEGQFYARWGDDRIKILDFGLGASDSLVVVSPFDPSWRMVQKVTGDGVLIRDEQSVDYITVTVEVYSDNFFLPYDLQEYRFERGLGETVGYSCNFECYSAFYPVLIAARINGQVLFGDITVSDGGDRADVPEGFHLEAAYPNPFNPATTLRFALERSGDVALEVYDMLGRRVLAQDLGALQTGEHRHTLDLSGRPSGTYLVRLQAGEQVRTTRVTLLK